MRRKGQRRPSSAVVFKVLDSKPPPPRKFTRQRRPRQNNSISFVLGINNTSQSMGVGQHHHPVNHTRPFFYVQPPSQPYYMYQWPMNPYGHYGFPGPALHFGRPYMAPYQFMQYPGYVIPHAPMQPIDYRRISPHFPSVASYDLRVRHHFQHQGTQRETACSEVQTDPSDSVNKLIDKIEGLKVCEHKAGDKGSNVVVSSTPDVIQGEKQLTCLNEESKLQLSSQEGKEEQVNQVRPTTYSDSAYDAESSQGRLDESMLSDALPLDSSSVHEEEVVNEDEDDQRSVADETCCQNEMFATNATDDVFCSSVKSTSDPSERRDLEKAASNEGVASEQVRNVSTATTVVEHLINLSEDFDLPYQILRLPCNKTTAGLSLEREIDPLVYFDSLSTLLPPQSYLSSIGGAYSYSYYPPVAQERQSVLSPSIDELSSRDEMFSTDVEDLDLIPGHVYVGGGRLAETSDMPVRSRKELLSVERTCMVCQKTCACCGSSLQDEGGVSKMPELCSHPERDVANEVSDQDCEYGFEGEVRSNCESPRVLKRKCCSRHALPPCGHHCAKHRHRKLICEGQESCELCEQARVHPKGECCEEHCTLAKADKRIQKGALCRLCIERQWREGVVSDQKNWASCGAKPRSLRHITGPQDQGRGALRRPTCKTFLQQRPSEYDDCETEFTFCQRGRGALKKRGTRY
ncbi:bucky ball-like [Myxocyprinus asiaticus]|uniref:bucky ball-like n=1 Tax=Myxocyprinus asiaticus TaxID=70543 RepID=UPI00222369A5|nr:bucky ball-like [Myxocyprinus asiaticus]